MKTEERKKQKKSDDATLFFLTYAQHYTSSFNIFDKRSFVSFIFDLFAKTNTHSLINELYKTYHILTRFFSFETISKNKFALYRRIELVLQQNIKRGVEPLRKLFRKYFLNLTKKRRNHFYILNFLKPKTKNKIVN